MEAVKRVWKWKKHLLSMGLLAVVVCTGFPQYVSAAEAYSNSSDIDGTTGQLSDYSQDIVERFFGENRDTTPVEVSLPVTFCQSKARSELSMVNEFRTGSDAWYWNSDNETKTILAELQNLTYDYDLEKVAMQRAVEIALYYSHTRADDKSCFETYSDYDYKCYAAGENIAYGYGSAEAVFQAWQETNENYSGQGHRRNMLDSNFTVCGFACVSYGGRYYWVQEFANPASADGTEAVTDAKDSVSVEKASICTDYITGLSRNDITLTAGDIKDASEIPVYMLYTIDGISAKKQISAAPTSSDFSADGDISMQDGVIYANAAGTATWTESYDIGGTRTVTSKITVEAASADHQQPGKPSNTNKTQKPGDTHNGTAIISIDPIKGTAQIPDLVAGENSVVPLAVVIEGAVYRMYNPNSGEHFYTKSSAERDFLIGTGWNYEENASFATIAADEDGAQPVYRVYNSNSGLHHYTMNHEEAIMLKNVGWNYEGISFYAFSKDSGIGSPQYRVYNPNDGQHHWTVDANEKNYLVSIGWNDEGVAWNVK